MDTWKENLRAAEWFSATVVCLFAIGTIRSWACQRQNKRLLWLLVAPFALLTYEAWFLLKAITVAFFHDWRANMTAAWILLTFYLWHRGNSYKEDAERARQMLRKEGPGA